MSAKYVPSESDISHLTSTRRLKSAKMARFLAESKKNTFIVREIINRSCSTRMHAGVLFLIFFD